MSKRKLNVNKDRPFKLVASGFPVMRFSDEATARESLAKFQGPGGCILISYAQDRRGKYIGYKFK